MNMLLCYDTYFHDTHIGQVYFSMQVRWSLFVLTPQYNVHSKYLLEELFRKEALFHNNIYSLHLKKAGRPKRGAVLRIYFFATSDSYLNNYYMILILGQQASCVRQPPSTLSLIRKSKMYKGIGYIYN